MIGAVIGDIIGSRFEQDNHKSKRFELFTKECRLTDDSLMTMAVAKGLMEAEKAVSSKGIEEKTDKAYMAAVEEMTIKYMQEIGRRYPNAGYGGRFYKWLFNPDPKPYNSFGNGAAMRISPVGFVARDEGEVKVLSKGITGVTHNHKEGLKGGEAAAMAVFLAKKGATKKEIRKRITGDYYPLDFTIEEIRDTYEFDVTCQGSVPQAIEAFLESASFEDALRIAVSLGGDSDTIAAIAGGIAEAYYGVPQGMVEKARTYMNEDLLKIYREWRGFSGGEVTPGKFHLLTKYLDKFSKEASSGQRGGYQEGGGSGEQSFERSEVQYRELTNAFVKEFFQFADSHPEYEIYRYLMVIEKCGFPLHGDSLKNAAADTLDAHCVLAFMMSVIGAERFSGGGLLKAIEEGYFLKWLKRLKEIDAEFFL